MALPGGLLGNNIPYYVGLDAPSAQAIALKAGISYPSRAAAASWQRLQLGNVILPGTALVTWTGDQNWQEGKGQGLDGANLTNKGRKLHRFTVQLRLAGPNDWSNGGFPSIIGSTQLGLVEAVSALNLDSSGKLKFQYSCAHPIMALCGVSTVVIDKISVPPPNPGQVHVVTLQLIEYQPPKPALTSPVPKKTLGQSLGAPSGTGAPSQPGLG